MLRVLVAVALVGAAVGLASCTGSLRLGSSIDTNFAGLMH